MKRLAYIVLIAFLGMFAPFNLIAQSQKITQLGLHAHYGFIFVHSKDVENTSGSRPIGLVLEYSKLKFDSSSFNLARCYPKTGFSLIYFNYDNKTLGHSVTGSYFLEPSFMLSKKLFFAPRGAVGLSFLTNPYHPINNPNNNSYSLPVSVFLQLGLSVNYKISKQLHTNFSVNYMHISNGGIKDPNKGINWPTASLGINYQLNDTEFKKQNYSRAKPIKKFGRFDAGVYSSSKIVAKGDKQRYFVPGVYAGYFKQLNNLHSVGIVSDFHLDYSLAEKQKRAGEPLHFHFASFALGHEFLMGKFTFWQHVGYYYLKPGERFINWYHRWGLNYNLTKNIAIGGSVKAHLHVAHFADLRLSYSFYRN
jgi:hypothetical protein